MNMTAPLEISGYNDFVSKASNLEDKFNSLYTDNCSIKIKICIVYIVVTKNLKEIARKKKIGNDI